MWVSKRPARVSALVGHIVSISLASYSAHPQGRRIYSQPQEESPATQAPHIEAKKEAKKRGGGGDVPQLIAFFHGLNTYIITIPPTPQSPLYTRIMRYTTVLYAIDSGNYLNPAPPPPINIARSLLLGYRSSVGFLSKRDALTHSYTEISPYTTRYLELLFFYFR